MAKEIQTIAIFVINHIHGGKTTGFTPVGFTRFGAELAFANFCSRRIWETRSCFVERAFEVEKTKMVIHFNGMDDEIQQLDQVMVPVYRLESWKQDYGCPKEIAPLDVNKITLERWLRNEFQFKRAGTEAWAWIFSLLSAGRSKRWPPVWRSNNMFGPYTGGLIQIYRLNSSR